MSVNHRADLQAVVDGLLPELEVKVDEIDYEVLSAPQPCERCGTTIVLLRWPAPALNWFELTEPGLRARIRPRRDGVQFTAGLPYHRPDDCTATRQANAELNAVDLDALMAMS